MMTTLPEAYQTLLRGLTERTREGGLKWTEYSRDTFSVAADGRSVVLTRWVDDAADRAAGTQLRECFEVEIRDDQGRLIDQVEFGPDGDGFVLARDLYVEARRNARDLRDIVREFLDRVA